MYVAENSNSALPLFYRVAALWGAHEGSLLLWIFAAGAVDAGGGDRRAQLPPRFAARVLGVLGLVSFGFLLFTLATSNPFVRLDPPAPDGRDLNPHPAGPGPRRASADPLHRLRRLRGGVRLRLRGHARRAGSIRTGRAGRARGPPRRGRFSPAASPWAAGGRTTSWAGAGYWFWDPVENASLHAVAGGHRARCIRWRSPTSAACSRAGRCCWPSWPSR